MSIAQPLLESEAAFDDHKVEPKRLTPLHVQQQSKSRDSHGLLSTNTLKYLHQIGTGLDERWDEVCPPNSPEGLPNDGDRQRPSGPDFNIELDRAPSYAGTVNINKTLLAGAAEFSHSDGATLEKEAFKPLHCPTCCAYFKDENERDQHIRRRSCVQAELREVEGISDEQRRKLDKRACKKNTVEENWYLTYEILFPGMDRPKSPYLDTVGCEHVESMRNFIDAEGGALPRGIVQSFITLEGGPRENQVEEWGRRLLEHYLEITIAEMSSREEQQPGTSLGGQASAAECQLPIVPAQFFLPSVVHQETVPEVSESNGLEGLWSKVPAFQSFNFEGNDMHAYFNEIDPDFDSSLYASLFANHSDLA
ncbi:hypothetical protein BDV97DRAFT_401622 [Delphinella strobiligena]|nr:hypothetical protein BDV97DRAFT_401622 [Delphinella strobiligena]